MTTKKIKKLLQQEPEPKRKAETKALCLALMESQAVPAGRAMPGFFSFLSQVLRHIGPRLWSMQAPVLLLSCAALRQEMLAPGMITVFTPLFVLASLPTLLQGTECGMQEIEAATAVSSAQLMLAKLVLALAADLVGLTVIIAVGLNKPGQGAGLTQLVLYALSPLLFCLSVTLCCVRARSSGLMQAGIVTCMGLSAFTGCLQYFAPQLYTLGATGFWLIAFILSGGFFAREIRLLFAAGKEGKIYGIIS